MIGMCWSGCWRWVCLTLHFFFALTETLNEEGIKQRCVKSEEDEAEGAAGKCQTTNQGQVRDISKDSTVG